MIISKNSKLNLLFKALGYPVNMGFLSKSQYWPQDKIKKKVFDELRKTLINAKSVPYYKALFSDTHFDPEYDFQSVEDLVKIPILTKDIFTRQYKEFINPKYKGIAVEYHTSGSTGQPMKMLLSPYTVAIDKAMVLRHHSWCTRTLRPTIFSLRSYVRKSEDAPLWYYDFLQNTWFFSAYDLNTQNASLYIDQLIKINPEIIRGYPSSISFLCDYLTSGDVKKLTRLRGVYTSSETLTEYERERIEARFGRKLFNWYGMTEPAVIIKECRMHTGMHVCWEYGYPEFLDSDQSNVKKLVTTSFYNHCMPFIRYETGDLVEINDDFNCCDLTSPTVKTVVGRKDDYIVGVNGGKLPSINFYTLFRSFEDIKAFQLVQYSTLELLVLIRAIKPLNDDVKQKLYKELRYRVGHHIPIHIKETERFFTNADGKVLVVLKRPGSYKLSYHDEYSVSTQKAWTDFDGGTLPDKLDWNEADCLPVAELKTYLKDLLNSEHLLNWYPETQHASLLNALRAYTGIGKSSDILLCNGSDNAIRLILQAFTSQSKCLVLQPNYDNFRAQCESFGNHVISVDYTGNTDPLDLLPQIKAAEPRLIYLTNPNNPIGYVIDNKALATIAQLAKSLHAILIIDEAYFEFYGKSATHLLQSYDNIIVLRTFSKAFGLAGLRIGYLVANREQIRELYKVYNPKDVMMLSAKAAKFMLDNMDKVLDYVKVVKRNRQRLYDYFEELSVRYYPSQGNYVSFVVDDVDEYLRFMETRHIYIRDRRRYFKENFVRVTVGGNSSFERFLESDKKFREILHTVGSGENTGSC